MSLRETPAPTQGDQGDQRDQADPATAATPAGRVTVVGIGADGLAGLSPRALEVLRRAAAIHGSPRQLELVGGDPELASIPQIELPRPLMPALAPRVARAAERGEVFLASGDPMFHGIGVTIARVLAARAPGARFASIPAPSAASLAAARLGWPLADIPTINLLTRPPEVLLPHLHPGARLFAYCADAAGPASVARLLDSHGAGSATVHVLSDLTPDGGDLHTAAAAELAGTDQGTWSDLVMLAIEVPERPWRGLAHGQSSRVPGLADEAFESDGQITKRIPRSVVMGLLRPTPGALLWDVGGGSGSISIEWMRAAPGARAVCFEIDPDRRARIERNAAALGIETGRHGLKVQDWTPPSHYASTGYAPLDDVPDVVFVGGGLTADEMLEWAWGAVRSGGRFVATAVTTEAETLLHAHRERHGGEMFRLGVEQLRPLGRYSGWEPARHLVIYVCEKGEDAAAQEGGRERR